MPDAYFIECRGYCGGFIYLDDSYWSLDESEVKPMIDILKRNMLTLPQHSRDYHACDEFVKALQLMVDKFEERKQSDDYAGNY